MVRDETVKITLQEIHEMCSKIKCIEISSLTKEKKLLCTASTAPVNFSYKRLLYLASSTYFLSFLQRFFSGNLSGDRRIIMLLTIKHFYTQGRGSTLQIRWKIIMLGKTGGLFTDSKFDISHACFALYVATPMEFALAALFDLGLDRFEAAVAAHGSTPVGSSGVFLAHPSLCS